MSSIPKATGLDNNAIYYEVSPTIICIMRLYNVLAALMGAISFTICLVKGSEKEAHYLLAINIVLSSFIMIVMNWWYRRKEIPADKYWVIFLLATVMIFQAITTDIYAFHEPKETPEMTTRHTFPTFSTTPYTGTTMTWRTINMSTITPPTLLRLFLDEPF